MSTSLGASRPSSASSSSFFVWFDRRIAPPLHRFGELAAIVSIREALPGAFIGLLVALLVLMWFVPTSGTTIVTSGSAIMTSSSTIVTLLANRIAEAMLPALGVMSIVLLVLLAMKMATRLRFPLAWFLPACILGYVLSLPQPFTVSQPVISSVLDYARTLGESGLFLSIVIVLTVAAIFSLGCRRWALSLVISVAVFAGLFFLHVSLADVLFHVIQPLGWLGDSYIAFVLIIGIETMLWTAGVHGPALLAAIITPVYLTLQTQNAEAFAHHQAMPHIVGLSLFLFAFPGGAGATLPLSVFFTFSRISRLRKLGRVSLLSGIVNINEPLLFGVPIVFNPFLAVPFVLSPLILATITYVAVAMRWVGQPIYYYPFSIPVFISTYLATLDYRAIVLVVVNIAVAGALYFPFFRAYERHVRVTEAA